MTGFIDLFSGIGGFALGAYRAGLRFDKHYFSEVDDYAIQVYKKHFPKAEILGDIRNVDYAKLPKGEYLVTGGFPCQPHSLAGKRGGGADERDLWTECARMLRELQPKIAVFENVPGLFVSDRGRFFNGILSDICESGYDAEWQIISAQDVGAPHLRKRVWIIAYSSNRNTDHCNDKTESEVCQKLSTHPDRICADMANATGNSERLKTKQKRRQSSFGRGKEESFTHADGDPCGSRRPKPEGQRRTVRLASGGNELADSKGKRQNRERGRGVKIISAQYKKAQSKRLRNARDWWAVEPRVGRVADGVSFRVDRLKGLGNAIVPQCIEAVFSYSAFDFWRLPC